MPPEPFSPSSGSTAMIASHEPGAQPASAARRLALLYLVIACVYILVSSWLVGRFALSPEMATQIEVIKGWLFIILTASLFYIIVLRHLRRIEQTELVVAQQNAALVDFEREATAGLFASSVAHDINNILTALSFEIEEVTSGTPRPIERDSAERLEQAIEQLGSLSKRLMKIGNVSAPGELVRLHLAPIIKDVVSFGSRHKNVRACTVRLALDGNARAKVSIPLLQQMVLNLLLNAAQAAGEKGIVEVRLLRTPTGSRLEVHDNGPGIADEDRDRVFQAFHTTRESGSGLGLVSVKACVKAHNGTITINDSPLGGAQFSIFLPDSNPSSDAVAVDKVLPQT